MENGKYKPVWAKYEDVKYQGWYMESVNGELCQKGTHMEAQAGRPYESVFVITFREDLKEGSEFRFLYP